ncbi:hypothetical protein KOI40_02060 [Aestuariicella sp. G3-2]|uniref:hypothetical protein n=1 Tax=Pseudomaricurvus albidus TaxID=2842452 RepID=UPI001C0C99C6|nr:hypothetical protein [Aestuariicella albida]MBU3068582.1 hypothetical protein [Aestuariicella albida]
MKLTKEEKDQLLQEIADDLPEYFAVFSPWMSLWLINMLLSIVGIAVTTVTLSEKFHVSFGIAYSTGIFFTVFFCLANGLVASGRRVIGTRLLKAIGYLLLVFGAISTAYYFNDTPQLPIFIFLSGLLSLLITHSLKFTVFAYHREKMGTWGRERIKKNRAFVEKIKKSRGKS